MPYAALVIPAGWNPGDTLLPSNVELLFRRIESGVDGDNGGSYAPTEFMQIEGAGIVVDEAPARIEPTLRTVRISALEKSWDSAVASGGDYNIYSPTIGTRVVSGIETLPGDTTLGFAFPLSRILDGTELVNVKASFWVPPGKTVVPERMPSLDVRRLNPLTGVAESLASGPQYYATPASIDAYTSPSYGPPASLGVPNVITFVPDEDKAVIDMSTYVYFAVYRDESDDNSGSGVVNVLSCIDVAGIVSTYGYV